MITDVVAAVLLLAGATASLIGAWGLLRLPDLLARLQAASKPITFGLLAILAGAALRVEPHSAATLLLVALFQVITAPVTSQLLVRATYRTGAADPGVLVTDELSVTDT